MKTDGGIVSYGAYVPRARLRASEVSRIWGQDPNMGKALNVLEKSVARPDEDVATISVEAALQATRRSPVPITDLGAIYVGSESHPYAVKPTGTIVQAAIGAPEAITMADYEFACKAGTAAIQTGLAMVGSGMAKLVLAIGADTSQGAPGNALEFSSSAGGAAFLIGKQKGHVLAKITNTCSFTTDTPDFWRREGQTYPSHGERFTGQPAYFRHVNEASQLLFSETGHSAKDYDYAIFHQPNGKFPVNAGKSLGFTNSQMDAGLLAPRIGNTYSGAAPLGLARALDEAKPGAKIFLCGYGSGAGSDAFHIEVTDAIQSYDRSKNELLETQLANPFYLDYGMYAKWRNKIVKSESA